ncbi:peptidase [Paenibacillus taichungensis]
MKKLMKSKSVGLLMGCALSLFLVTNSASASVSSDPYNAGKVGTVTYKFTSEIWDRGFTTGTTVEAVSFVKADYNVTSGYMGANARLYVGSTMKASSGMTYNDSSVSGFYVYSDRLKAEATYWSQTAAEFYHGNGYTKFVGYKSPNFILKQKNLVSTLRSEELVDTETPVYIQEVQNRTEYNVNANGETFGSGLSAETIGVDPDLIEAYGTNGLKGFVKSSDLEPTISTPEEALAINPENGAVKSIPLYEVDGVTIIGQFDLVTRYEAVQ